MPLRSQSCLSVLEPFRGFRAVSRFSCSFAVSVFFLWVILRYALGGWELGWFLFSTFGLPAWIALAAVVALILYRSDYRIDVPLFIAGFVLGYWGEWWGTTHNTSTSCG
jgi:hypothetical protein